jgi:hypothetical protein
LPEDDQKSVGLATRIVKIPPPARAANERLRGRAARGGALGGGGKEAELPPFPPGRKLESTFSMYAKLRFAYQSFLPPLPFLP